MPLLARLTFDLPYSLLMNILLPTRSHCGSKDRIPIRLHPMILPVDGKKISDIIPPAISCRDKMTHIPSVIRRKAILIPLNPRTRKILPPLYPSSDVAFSQISSRTWSLTFAIIYIILRPLGQDYQIRSQHIQHKTAPEEKRQLAIKSLILFLCLIPNLETRI